MKAIFILTFLFSIALPAQAELLENLDVLKIEKRSKEYRVKLTQVDKAKGNHFYIVVDKKDPRLKKIIKYLKQKRKLKVKYSLQANIPSFTYRPYGSVYPSSGLIINGTTMKEREAEAPKLPPRGF